MNFKNIPPGKHIPDDIYVIIEIPAQSTPVKYEIDKETGVLFVDRFIHVPMFYPCNYGYINHTLTQDGDPIDVLIMTPHPLHIGSVIRCHPVGVLNMIDEAGDDCKIIAVPHHTLSQDYENITNITDVPDTLRKQIIHFFKYYKKLNHDKWVKIQGWDNAEIAKHKILFSCNQFNTKQSNK